MKIGVLVTGDTAVRAAHSLSADPSVDQVVVIGPATSKSFEVVETAQTCDYLIGTGREAPKLASQHGVPLIGTASHHRMALLCGEQIQKGSPWRSLRGKAIHAWWQWHTQKPSPDQTTSQDSPIPSGISMWQTPHTRVSDWRWASRQTTSPPV